MRLDSYENDENMDKVRSILDGRLANTAFAVYTPDGKTQLTDQSRGVHRAFGRHSIEQGLVRISKTYPGRQLNEPAHTPDFSSLREAVNTAACDERPLVLAWANNTQERGALEVRLRPLAWSPELVGRLHWDLSVGDGLRDFVEDAPEGDSGVIIVQSEPYGRTASLITALDLDDPLDEQVRAVQDAIDRFDQAFSKLPYEQHVREGLKQRIVWSEAVRMSDRDDGPDARRDGEERSRRERPARNRRDR